MSFDIRQFVGKPEAVMYFLDNYQEHGAATPLLKPIREAVHVWCERLQKGSNALVLFSASGYIASDGSAELHVELKTVSQVP